MNPSETKEIMAGVVDRFIVDVQAIRDRMLVAPMAYADEALLAVVKCKFVMAELMNK